MNPLPLQAIMRYLCELSGVLDRWFGKTPQDPRTQLKS